MCNQNAMAADFPTLLLGMGNPLLDIGATVDGELLKKYELKENDAILADEAGKHDGLYAELEAKPDVKYYAGGATMSSIRVAQWMLTANSKAKVTKYIGCVGSDDRAEKLTAACAKNGVTPHFLQDSSTPTGRCGVCVNGAKNEFRSMVTQLYAANNYKISHLKENLEVLENAKVVYSAGFFMTVSPDSMVLAAEHCAKNPAKTYCVNLSAPFLMQVPPFKKALLDVMPNADFVFGNETEALTFAETEGWETKDVAEIAAKIQKMPKANGKPRVVVITQGADATLLATDDGCKSFPVIKVDNIVDTNGAGDAFVGGFLSGLCLGKSLEECVKAGQYCGAEIIQQSGVALESPATHSL